MFLTASLSIYCLVTCCILNWRFLQSILIKFPSHQKTKNKLYLCQNYWFKTRRVSNLYAESENRSKNPSTDDTETNISDESNIQENNYGRPSVIPFDQSTFAREDILSPELKAAITKSKSAKKISEQQSTIPPVSSDKINAQTKNLDNDRPTGYDNDNEANEDEKDDIPSWIPTQRTDEPYLLRVLKDTYIGSPYDSDARKQARYVVRNITGISVAIGLIFTVVWYAFPGQFISFRGGAEEVAAAATRRYAAAYVDPDDLLNSEISSPDWEYFEEF